VLRALKEMLAQLLGAAAFAVYFASDDGTELVAITSEGVEAAEVARQSVNKGPIGRAFATGEVLFSAGHGDGPLPSTPDLTKPSSDDAAAVIPLQIDGRVIGVIAIFGTLPQKTEFVHLDQELFKLLGAQPAPALVNARLFTDTGRKVPGIQAFLDLED